MYVVPMEIPEHCNKCPFGYCNYSFPSGSGSISGIDGEENKAGTYGYVCNIELQKSGKYTKILRAEWGKDIKKPKWCSLQVIGERFAAYDADEVALALEKRVPYRITYQNGFGYCKCGCEFEREGYEGEEYCPECGQKVWVGGYNGQKNKIVSFAGGEEK